MQKEYRALDVDFEIPYCIQEDFTFISEKFLAHSSYIRGEHASMFSYINK